MKFQLAHGQETKSLGFRNLDQLDLLLAAYSDGDICFNVSQRKRKSWNLAIFSADSNTDDFSSVCSGFTLASKHLYADELSIMASKFEVYSSRIAWPDLVTVDRHYFIQILNGVIRSCFPCVVGTVLLNTWEFYSGTAYPVLSLRVKDLPWQWLSRKRYPQLSDES